MRNSLGRFAVALLWSVVTLLCGGCATQNDSSAANTVWLSNGGLPENPPEDSGEAAAVHSRAAATRPAEQTEVQVSIDNFSFSPKVVTVARGTKVTWTNRDDVPHTATSNAEPQVFDSKAIDTDQHYSFTFTTAGTYDYFCLVHPHMKGQVIVK